MEDSILYFIIVIILFALSAFFSGSETAFFSINKLQLKKIESSGDKTSKRVLKLLEKPTYLLILILLGNTLVNIGVSSLSTLIAIRYNMQYHTFSSNTDPVLIGIQILITTVLLLTIGEIIPKLFAFGNCEKFAGYSSYILQPLGIIFYPILKPIELVVNLISKKDVVSAQETYSFTSEDFKNLVKSESADHPLEDNEKEIIAGIFRFSTTEVREIIQPRVDIVAVEENDTLDCLKEKIKESGYSRIPVFKENIDEITGIIYVKDMILNNDVLSIKEVMRPAFFVTENTKIQTLFNQFKTNKIQIAIVVDEYGGTSGLVTLEDILEELVGDIQDEYDIDEPEEITQISDNEYKLSGMVGISEINEKLTLDIDTDEFDNLADYLLSEFNHIPEEGESVKIENIGTFVIEKIAGQRIEFVNFSAIDSEEEND